MKDCTKIVMDCSRRKYRQQGLFQVYFLEFLVLANQSTIIIILPIACDRENNESKTTQFFINRYNVISINLVALLTKVNYWCGTGFDVNWNHSSWEVTPWRN